MSRVFGAALVGVDGVAVEVEVRISSLLPRVDIVGLPEAAVRESSARVRGAIAGTGFAFPDRRITVNLAPAAIRKSGAGLDLPIAVGILAASRALEASIRRPSAERFAGAISSTRSTAAMASLWFRPRIRAPASSNPASTA